MRQQTANTFAHHAYRHPCACPAPHAPTSCTATTPLRRRERQQQVDKDIHRTDRAHPFFAAEGGQAAMAMRRILLTYAMYAFDTGYCQVRVQAGSCLVLCRPSYSAYGPWPASLPASPRLCSMGLLCRL